MAKPEKAVYEIGVVLVPTLDEKGVEDEIEKFKSLVQTHGVELDKIDLWGKRRLEYEIARRREGIFFFAMTKIASHSETPLDKVRRSLRINENVLRELVIKYDHIGKKPKKQLRRVRGGGKAAEAAKAAAPAEAEVEVEREDAEPAASAQE
jgi:small subunit ribosomal protein S6